LRRINRQKSWLLEEARIFYCRVIHDHADNAPNRPDENFKRRMSQKFAEARFADWMTLEEFIDDLIENAGLNARGATNTRRVIHHNDGKQK
jgi:hypothetical protein